MSLDELRPTAVAALRPRIETVILQETFDSCSRDIVDAELLEFAQDSTVAPPGGLGHVQNELPDLFRLSGTATLAGLLSGLTLAQPAGKGSRMDDGNDLLDLRAEPHAELQQFGPFRRGRFDPFGQSAAKHAVLGLEILDHLDEFLLRRTRQEQQEGVYKPLHVGTIRKSLVEMEMTCFWTPATQGFPR